MDTTGHNDEKGYPPTTDYAPPHYSVAQNQYQPPVHTGYPQYPTQPGYGQPPTVIQYGYGQPQSTAYTQSAGGTQVLVVGQPVMGQAKPNNYLALSIITCLCCVWPIGLVAIVFSVMVDSSYSEGNLEKARSYSKVALALGLTSLILGVVFLAIFIPLYVIQLNSYRATSTYYNTYG